MGLIVHLRVAIMGEASGKLVAESNGMENSGTNGIQGNTKATSYLAALYA
ncbi:hypothetical protein [Nitrosospira multiformis]|nr:hypothetical protein [Nitrosospira multiformis]